ncbi:hypothetical protein, partial [Mycobacterium tuberculosis]|uniref:hypothetical protein n=1 Tax=Mycobacterium tuberculosis TaxID=1773 RepID=UPI00254A4DF3
ENQETCSNIQDNLMQIDEHDSFPTMNSGSWSALMQDAVEASSSDTGINEKWSGLKLPSGASNMQSLTSTLPLFSDADKTSNFNQPMKFT